MKVYILDAQSNDYQNLAFSNRETMEEMWERFDGAPMAARWTPPRVEVILDKKHRNRPPSDFPSLGGYVPVFSRRAVDCLGQMLTGAGELLPLDCASGEYFALNVTQLVDALDVDRSQIKRFSSSNRIMDITEHVFVAEKLGSFALFKLPQVPRLHVYATDLVVDSVRRNGLTGFLFTPVWGNS